MNKNLTIIAVNIRGAKGKIKSLESMMNTEKEDIALLSETNLKGKETINIKGYRWIGKNRQTRAGGGVGILIKENI